MNSAAQPYVSLAQAKEWLCIEDDSKNAELALLIDAVSDSIVTTLARDLWRKTYTVRYSGLGSTRLAIPFTPLQSVTTLKIDTVTIPPAGVNVPGYYFDENSIELSGYAFTRGIRNIELTISAGYDALPAAVVQAARLTLNAFYNAKNSDQTVAGEQAGQILSKSYWPEGPGSVPRAALSLLAPYVRRISWP